MNISHLSQQPKGLRETHHHTGDVLRPAGASMFAIHALLMLLVLVPVLSTAAEASVTTSYLYPLANFDGPVRSNWADICVDRQRTEIYVLDPQRNDVRIFNSVGMEIFHFGEEDRPGRMLDLAVREDGDILVLERTTDETFISLRDFRGLQHSRVEIQGLSPEFSRFRPEVMCYRKGRIYLADTSGLRIVILDGNGKFVSGFDIAPMIEVDESKRTEVEIGGFSVDGAGNMLFTIPVFFVAYRLTPEGKLSGFGRPGSAPGRFGVVGGIVCDDEGFIYVADRLKCAVLIFDANFKFLREFGYRGNKPDNLVGPKDLALDSEGRLYVSQLASRGVSVFKLIYSTTVNRSAEGGDA